MAIDDLLASQTEDELFDQFCTDAATLDYPVDVRGMQPERWAVGQLHVEAKAHEAWQARRVQLVESWWLQTARGDSLRLHARGIHDIEAFGATYASHQLRLTDTGGVGPVVVTAGERVAYAANGQEFRNVSGFTVPAGAYVDAEFRAEVAGSAANVAVGAIGALRAPIVGVSVSNPAIGATGTSLLSAGRDVETDEQLRQRIRDHWSSVGSGGNAAAYRYWVHEAFTIDGLTSTITRVKILDNNPYGPGSIGVIIANAAGGATGAELTRVDTYLQSKKSLGSGELRVDAATGQTVLVTATVYVATGYSVATVLANVEASLDAYESEFSIGGKVYKSEVLQRIMDVDGVYNATVVDPASDVTINPTAIVSFSYALTGEQ